MIFKKLVSLVRSNPSKHLQDDQKAFLKLMRAQAKKAYPGFQVISDLDGEFSFFVKTGDDAPSMTAHLDNVFELYRDAEGDVEQRRAIVEKYLSAIGNTVIAMDAPVTPEKFVIQLRHESLINHHAGDPIYLPFLGDLVAVLMCDSATTLKMVTQANLDTLGIGLEQALAIAIGNTASLVGDVAREVAPEWPGLSFVTAASDLPTALIYRDYVLGQGLPDGAYVIYDRFAYAYAAANDEATRAILDEFRELMMTNSGVPISSGLLIRQKGKWILDNVMSMASAA